MASNIDPSKPITGNPTTQSVRDNFNAAKQEIESLQTAVSGKADASALALKADASALALKADASALAEKASREDFARVSRLYRAIYTT